MEEEAPVPDALSLLPVRTRLNTDDFLALDFRLPSVLGTLESARVGREVVVAIVSLVSIERVTSFCVWLEINSAVTSSSVWLEVNSIVTSYSVWLEAECVVTPSSVLVEIDSVMTSPSD